MTEKVVQEKDISLWQVLVALITDPGSRAAFREGWKKGVAMAEAEQAEAAEKAAAEKTVLAKTADTRVEAVEDVDLSYDPFADEDEDGVYLPNAWIEGSYLASAFPTFKEMNPFGRKRIR